MKTLARWRFAKSRGRSLRELHKPGATGLGQSRISACEMRSSQSRKSSNTDRTHLHHHPVTDARTAMQIDANRKSTFLGTPAATFLEAVPVKRTAKSKAAAIPTNGPRWPHTATTHPRLTPEELARAGYYYAPEPVSKPLAKGKARRTTSRAAKSATSKASTSRAGRKTKASATISDTDPSDTQTDVDAPVIEEADDQCCCFTCGKKLGGWDETDDPYEEHWKRSESVAVSGGGEGTEEDIACAWATAVCSVVIHVKRWKEGALTGTSGNGTTGKRSKTKQVPRLAISH